MLFLSLWRQEVSINRGFLQLKWPKVIKMCCGIVPVHAHGGISVYWVRWAWASSWARILVLSDLEGSFTEGKFWPVSAGNAATERKGIFFNTE